MSLFSRFLEPEPRLPLDRQSFTNSALRKMIIPLLIEQLLQMIVGIADTLMVSYAGEATVSGVSLDTMLYTIFIYLFTAVATGGAVVVSQYIGLKDKRQSDLAASQLYTIAAIVSVVCMGLVLVLGPSILNLLYPSVEPAVMAACRTYLWIVTLSFPANALYNAGAALYRSMGRTRTTMYVSVTMNLLNVVGNAIGIFVFKAGAAGVAWPTTLSWYFAAVVMTRLCLNPKGQVTLRLGKDLMPQKDMSLRILRIAVPNAIENTLGTSQIAANGIGQTIWSLAACMCVSMGPVFITVIGQCMGAGDTEAAEWYMHKLTRLSLALAILWNLLVLALLPLILPLYNVSAETKHLILVIVIIHNAFAALVQPFSSPLSAGLRAAGDVKFTMWSSIFATVVCRTILSFILGLWLNMGVVGIALAMGLDWCIKGALDIIRWRSGKWKQFKVI